MVGAVGGFNNNYSLQAQKKERYNEVYQHELAHKNAAGIFGGSIVIDTDSSGMATGGHVDIMMPTLDKENPDKTIKHADTVIKAAMAPHDPSDQDYRVAAEAKSIRSQAQSQQYQTENSQGENSQGNDEPALGRNINFIA